MKALALRPRSARLLTPGRKPVSRIHIRQASAFPGVVIGSAPRNWRLAAANDPQA